MNVAEILFRFRNDVDDATHGVLESGDPRPSDLLWSDEEILNYLNEAVNEACERALLIEDRQEPDVCEIDLEAGVDTYDLHPAVIKVKRATFNGRLLEETSVEAMDARSPCWETRVGEPRHYICEGTASIRVLPTPAMDGLIRMTVYRTPLTRLKATSPKASPEIKPIYHERLLSWMFRCAYLKQDADSVNELRSMRYEKDFIAAFGERPDANVQRKRRDRAPPLIQSNW